MKKKTILIVDDTFENLYLLRVILEEAGYAIIEAKDGSEGLNKLNENNDVDLIISDILMPVMDGFMFCQACKKDELFKNIPFVFYTSTYTEKLDEDFALKLGAAKFLRKPIDHDEVILTLNNIFGGVNKPSKNVKKAVLKNEDVFKLYNERLINKLEHKSLVLGKEVIERKKAEQLLIQKNEILELIADNTPLNKVIDHIIVNYQSNYPSYFASVSLLNEDGVHLDHISAPSLPESYNLALKRVAIGKNVGSCGTAAFTKKPVIVSDISKNKLWQDYKDIALKHNLKSCWSIPILTKSKDVIGTFAIYSKSINSPNDEEIIQLNYTVNLAYTAIEKAKIVAENKKKDESYKSLINQASDAIVTYSFDGTIHDFNKSAYTNLGYTKREFLKLNLQNIIEGDIIINPDRHEKILNGKSIIFERRLIHKDGTLIACEISAKYKKDGIALAIVRDITERKNAEDRILKSERYLENIINNIGDPVFVKDDKSHFLLANDAFYKFFNRTKEEIIGRVVAEDVPADERERYLAIDNRVISTGKENIYEVTASINGETRFISAKKTRFVDEDGKIYLIGVLRDITESKQAELKINKSEKSLTEAQKIAKIGSFNLDIKTQVAQTSKSFNEIIEVDDNFELTFDIWKTIVFSEDRSRIKETVNECEKNRQKFDLEYRIIPKNKNKIKWIHGLGEFYFINGEANNFIGTIQDITERKEAEIQLKAATEFSDKLIMSMQEGLIMINLDGKILLVNDSTCKILGYSEKELVGLELPYPFAKIEDLEEIEKTKEKVINGETLFQFEFIKKSGKKFLASFSTGNIKNDKGEVIAMFATMKDVSKEEKAKKILEENVKKSNLRKDAIVKLASYVGEDFDETLNKVTALAAKTLDVERVSVWQLNEDQTENYCKNLYNLKTDFYSNGFVLKKADHPEYFKQLEEKNIVSVNDAESNVLTKSMAKDYLIPNNITSKISIAINGRDGLYGIICFEHVGEDRIWDYDEEEFAISISNIVSLMIESTERKLAESELKTQKEFSEELITSLNEGLSVIDLNGKHIKVNGALCKMTGFSEEELLGGGAPFPYWPPEEKDNIMKAFNDPLNNLGVMSKWTFMRKSGERFPVSLTSSTIKNHDGEIIAYFSTIIDIADSVKAENFLKEVAIKSTEKKNVIMKLSGLVGADYRNALQQITSLSAVTMNVQRAGIWKFNEDRSAIICEMLYDIKTSEFESGVILSRDDNPNYFNALAENKTINVEDAVNNDVTKGFAKDYLIPFGISSMLDVFIQGENEIFGVICFEHVGPQRKWSADDEEFALSIANVVSLMVESTERKLAEENLISSNEALLVANTELEKLRSQLVDENVYLRNEIDLVFNYEEMVYGSEVFSAVLTEVEKVATTNATVLLLGESGTGKELLARAIQNIGNRKHKPLIKVNCAAIPRELIESELFGHVKGSFTGAINDKVGKFELADGGTLFLDEIGELPLDMQPKLLRFLQEGEIEKVGDTRTLKVDVRIIAATNKDLKKEVEKKLFREDLYFRLNVFPIMVPPLRERTEDIPLLIEHFADKFSKAYGKEVTYITDGAMLAMKRYKWPGNIRELENVIERAVILSNNNYLVLPDFDTKLQTKERLIAASDLTLDDVQREHIIKTLDKCNWKIDGANGASLKLNIKPSTLRDRMKKLGVVKPL